MKKFLKISNAFSKPTSFIGIKLGKKHKNGKHKKDGGETSIGTEGEEMDVTLSQQHLERLEESSSKPEPSLNSPEIIQQTSGPSDETTSLNPIHKLDILDEKRLTQSLAISKDDEMLGLMKPNDNNDDVKALKTENDHKGFFAKAKASTINIMDKKKPAAKNHEVQKKIQQLEQQSQDQSTQISEMKKMLETCLNRIETLETSPGKSKATPNHLDLSKRGVGMRPKPSATTPRTPVRALRQSSGTTRRSTPDLVNHKELSFNKGEGSIRIFLKGRPINLYVPPNLRESIDVKKSQPLPDEDLKMEWVYGYRGRDCRKNVFYQPTSGDLVYFVAGVVVLHNLSRGDQRHYIEHTDDVKCLAIHPDQVTFASGQVAGHGKHEGKPHVRVWSSITLQTLHVIGLGHFERAVAALAFSKSDNGLLLCTVDEANDHNLTVWDWAKKKSLATSKSSTEPVLEVEFDPKESSSIYSCGKNHLAFWTYKSNSLSKKAAIYEKYEKPKIVNCMTFSSKGELITGDSSGNVYLWNIDRRGIQRQIPNAHEGPIFSVLSNQDGATLITAGGKDHTVTEWDLENLEKKSSFTLETQYGGGRAITSIEAGKLVIGTTCNSLLQVTWGESTEIEKVLLAGHHDELWGLSTAITSPSSSFFLSAGFDKQVLLWNCVQHSMDARIQMDFKVQSVAGFKEDLFVVGGTEGQYALLSVSQGEIKVLDSGKEGIEAIQCCEFSLDGTKVALGSRDNAIYVFKLNDDNTKMEKTGKCSGHSSFITHIDWSADGQCIRSNSGDYELLIWNSDTCKQQIGGATETSAIEWASCNCTIAFEVAGIWPEGSDGTDINAVTKAHAKELLATADDFGKVNLYRYPAYASKSNHKMKAGHSSHVTNVKFINDDKWLLSSGGQDTAIIQWALV